MKSVDLKTPLGVMRLTEEQGKLVSSQFVTGKNAAVDSSLLLDEARRQLNMYFCGKLKTFDLPFAVSGTAFERLVMNSLLKIPYGQTRSYGQIAEMIGCSGAARAVGRACSKNRLLVFIPCHRVISANGRLTGFAGGIGVKRGLLTLEGVRLEK